MRRERGNVCGTSRCRLAHSRRRRRWARSRERAFDAPVVRQIETSPGGVGEVRAARPPAASPRKKRQPKSKESRMRGVGSGVCAANGPGESSAEASAAAPSALPSKSRRVMGEDTSAGIVSLARCTDYEDFQRIPRPSCFSAKSRLRSRSRRCCSRSAAVNSGGLVPGVSSITMAPM